MGNLFCPEAAHLAAVARDFCPFPDYSPSPLLNTLTVNSSLHLSEHYATVQNSLTPPQQQDFTHSLRKTFGREGTVSYGGVGIVALSLAVLFDTVAREVKEQYVSDQEPIPGLFLKDPRGDYPAPVYTVSKYLRLVPHIANNPSRMKDETEKYLQELSQGAEKTVDAAYASLKVEDITGLNLMACYIIGKNMLLHLERLSNETLDEKTYMPQTRTGTEPELVFNLNCDPSVASQTFFSAVDSLDSRTQEAFKRCKVKNNPQAMEGIAADIWYITLLTMDKTKPGDKQKMLAQKEEFDLKQNALGRWI